jgi:probable DNA repair protein
MSLPLSPAYDAWLSNGGTIVTASDRAARNLRNAFSRQRLSERVQAWPTPDILDWTALVLRAWSDCALDDRMVLNRAQEEFLWAGIVADHSGLTAFLPEARHRLAQEAMQAYALLSNFSPRHLDSSARKGWTLDKAAFSAWLTAFDAICRARNAVSPGRTALEIVPRLATDATVRPPLLLVGFDRLQPTQKAFLEAWGPWRFADAAEPARTAQYWSASDGLQELEGCASWCSHFLQDDPTRSVLIVSQEVAERRGEMERAFLEHLPGASSTAYEFSLGIPLDESPAPKANLLMLRWLTEPLEETAIDWLFSTGYASQAQAEKLALLAAMRSLRDAGLQRPNWTLAKWIQMASRKTPLPSEWTQRMQTAERRCAELASVSRQPSEWSEWTVSLQREMRPQGDHALSSAEFQAMRRWDEALDTCASLGFSGARISWREFLATLSRVMKETLFSPESEDAPVLITGPSEAAGLHADAIWFLGVNENSWPPTGKAHPFLPLQLQKDAGMPHADALQEWTLAEAMTARLMASAPIVQFSFARRSEAAEQRPSGIALKIAPLQSMLSARFPALVQDQTLSFRDAARIPLTAEEAAGGARILTTQSQCAFKAFATYRLGARGWNGGQPFLNHLQRGELVHAVLRSIWSGPPNGLLNSEDLQKRLPELETFVSSHVHRLVPHILRGNVEDWMPARYLDLERTRLTQLMTEWLEYESARMPFTVAGVEEPRPVSVAGLSLNLRMDRVDRLSDGSAFVMDYKTGEISPTEWRAPRPGDVQLPLYATFALPDQKLVGGLAFALVRAGKAKYAGHFTHPGETLFAGLRSSDALIKSPLTLAMLDEWRHCIEQLAVDYLGGRADVDPRKEMDTCRRCDLQALCRIRENRSLGDEVAEEDEVSPDA